MPNSVRIGLPAMIGSVKMKGLQRSQRLINLLQKWRQHRNNSTCQHFRWPWLLAAVLGVTLLAVSSLAVAQDAPASDTKQTEADEKEKEKPKPPFEIGQVIPRFGDPTDDVGGDEGPRLVIKPGHWTSTTQSMQANYKDFLGEFSAEGLDDSRQPVAIPHTEFGLQITRSVTLPKGEEREVDVELFVPQQTMGTRFKTTIVDRDTGGSVFEVTPKLEFQPAYQYQFVVLAAEPAKYAFLKVTNTVRAPWEEEFEESSQAHYLVTLAKTGKQVPLPESSLAWTSVAYLVWDSVDPSSFTLAQQKAMLDWLHWGGRLIINGPDSLAMLEGGFLEPFLPAEDAGPRKVTAEELTAWSDFWRQREAGKEVTALEPRQTFPGIELNPLDGAKQLPGAAGLFYVKNVGRGAVVVSAIQLSEREFINWPGFDGFLNAGLLGRPRRLFSTPPFEGVQVDWADYQSRRLDAHLTTPLRLFARDAQTSANTQRVPGTTPNQFGTTELTELKVDRPGGVAAWDEFSQAAQVCRELLIVAAGVQVPGVGFVLGCLAFYLIVLVPFNWLIFHTIGRPEWAWIAVPFIAMFGTWVVVKQAQLDIGFVRSQTEVAILELNGDHDRGLLTRFAAMYSSLATTYDTVFPNQTSAVALPFPANNTDPAVWKDSVVFDESIDPQLTGLTVSSSATRLLHAEQIVPLAGPLKLAKSSRGTDQIENHTEYDLRDVAVVRRRFDRNGEPKYDASWLGELRKGSSTALGLASIGWQDGKLPFVTEREASAKTRALPSMAIDPLVQLAFAFDDKNDPVGSKRDEVRLVGVIDEPLPGMEITPEASQRQGATVVIAHLSFGPLAEPRPDVNSPSDVPAIDSTEESP
jgi:hypothetical protein